MNRKNFLIQYSIVAIILLFILFFSVFGSLSLTDSFLLLLLAGIGILLFRKPFYGFLFLIILRPAFDRLGNSYLLFSSNASIDYNSILALLVIGWGIFFLWKNFARIKELPAKSSIFFFSVFLFLSLFWAPSFGDGLREWLRISSIFIVYGVAFILIHTQKRFRSFSYALASSALLPSIFAFGQFFQGKGEVVYGEHFQRLYGTFFTANGFAFFLVLIIAVLILLLIQAKEIFPKIFYGGSLLGVFFLLLHTYTRGAWLGAFLLLILLGALKFHKMLLVGLLIVLLLYVFLPLPGVKERISNLTSLTPFSSLVWRFHLWGNMVPFFLEKPFLGHGLFSFQFLSQKLQGLNFLPAPEAHNDYLRISIETGLVGLGLYFVLLWQLARFSFKICCQCRGLACRRIGLITFSLLVVFALMALGDNILRNTAVEWLLFSLLGASASLFSEHLKLTKKKG